MAFIQDLRNGKGLFVGLMDNIAQVIVSLKWISWLIYSVINFCSHVVPSRMQCSWNVHCQRECGRFRLSTTPVISCIWMWIIFQFELFVSSKNICEYTIGCWKWGNRINCWHILANIYFVLRNKLDKCKSCPLFCMLCVNDVRLCDDHVLAW